jgi:hypothetical protein
VAVGGTEAEAAGVSALDVPGTLLALSHEVIE